jgi:hypothetical protein
MLVQLASIFSMSHTHQGLLGGIVYLMISLGGLIAGYCFKHYCTRWVLGCSLAANNIATLLFALTPVGRPESAVLLIFYRGLIGFTQVRIPTYLNFNAQFIAIYRCRRSSAYFVHYGQTSFRRPTVERRGLARFRYAHER